MIKLNNSKILFPFAFILISWLLTFAIDGKIVKEDIIGKHSWRQTMTQSNIRHFIRDDANIFNPQRPVSNIGIDDTYVVRYEFPLMQWVVAMVQRVIGESIIASRVMFLLIGFFSAFGFYKLLREIGFNREVSSYMYWILMFSPVFYFYKFNPLPDNLALCFSFWYLYFHAKALNRNDRLNHFYAALFLSLAGACKLPFILTGIASAYYFMSDFRKFKDWKSWCWYIILALPTLYWYYKVIPTWAGNNIAFGILSDSIKAWDFMKLLILNQTYLIPYRVINLVIVPSMLYVLFLLLKKRTRLSTFHKTIIAALIGQFVIFLYELNLIKLDHDYYLMPFMPIYLLIGAYGLKYIIQDFKPKVITKISVLALSAILCFYITMDDWSVQNSYLNSELYTHTEELRQAIPPDAKCIFINDPSLNVMAYKVDKRGKVFNIDQLPREYLVDLIARDKMEYMYSNVRSVDEAANLQDLLDSIIYQVGEVRIVKLKSK